MATAEPTAALDAETGAAIRDLILVLADSKRLLGMRYAEWILGAPELEAGIACASMAQDEWGHARLLYSLLRDFGEDVPTLEHGREASAYFSMEVLDRPAAEWTDLVALNAFVDGALTLQLEALRGTSYTPVRQRIEKMLEEERFHVAHGEAWFRRLADSSDAARTALRASAERILPGLLRWFGPGSPRADGLVERGVVQAAGPELRRRFMDGVQPLLDRVGSTFAPVEPPDFGGFDEASRRASMEGPDPETIARVRGDLNRVFRLD